MAETTFRGPVLSVGPLIGNVVTQGGVQDDALEPTDGPSADYQASGFADPRYFFNKDSLSNGRLPIFMNGPDGMFVDALPSASTATPQDIAANQATVSGAAMTLVTTQPSATTNGQCAHMPAAPMVLFSTGAVVTTGIGLDMGFCYGTTTAGSGTVTVLDSTLFSAGQWIVIGGAGNAGTTVPLITQVTNPSASATTITVAPVALGSVTRGPISSGNAYFGFPSNVSATAVSPYSAAGVARAFNPLEAVQRVVGINATAGAAGGAFTVNGWDIYGVPMSEVITVGAGAAVKYGNKAFKFIKSVVPGVTDAAAHYGVGVGDVIGMPLRSDRWEYLVAFVNQAQLTVATGWTQALQPPSGPSTTTTADVRGTVQVGTRGNNTGVGGAGATGGPFSGTVRVAINMTPPVYNLLNATPNNATSLFGLAQV